MTDESIGDAATDHAIDLTGVGKAMRSIPPDAWRRLVGTACTTFEKFVSPITETTHGIGRLIEQKFDALVDAQKVMAVESVAKAQKKAEQSGREVKTPRPQILVKVIEHSANETDSGVRELWSNLLAQEMITQRVHPECARVLSRISSEDAQLLVTIAERTPSAASSFFASAVRAAIEAMPIAIPFTLESVPSSFNHEHLRNLGLIEKGDGDWQLTVLGEGFIRAVTDPILENNSTTQPE